LCAASFYNIMSCDVYVMYVALHYVATSTKPPSFSRPDGKPLCKQGKSKWDSGCVSPDQESAVLKVFMLSKHESLPRTSLIKGAELLL
jgi:hypothetical protein